MKRKFTIEEKLKIIEQVRATSLHEVSRKTKIDRKSLRSWIKKENSLQNTPKNQYRITGGGRKIMNEELDNYILHRFEHERYMKHTVSRSKMMNWANEFMNSLEVGRTCSAGWLESFLNRNNLVIRKSTNQPKLSDEETCSRAITFLINNDLK